MNLRIPALMVAAVVAAAACSSGGSSPTNTGTAETPTSSTAASPSSDAGKQLFIGIVELQASGQFSSIQVPAITAAMEKRGWKTTVVDPDGDPAAANNAMVNLITRGVDVLVVQTFPVSALVTGMAAAEKAGVPVFGTGGAEAGSGMAGAISSNAVNAMNDYAIAFMKDKEKVELLELTYTAGPPCLARREGMDSQVAQHSNISPTSLPFTIPGADQATQTATTGWLQSHPEVAGTTYAIWICTSEGLGGTVAAEKQLKRGPYPIFTWDISAPAVQAIKDGMLTAVIALPANLGAEQLAQMIADQQTAGASWQQKTEDAKFLVITKDNLDQAVGTY